MTRKERRARERAASGTPSTEPVGKISEPLPTEPVGKMGVSGGLCVLRRSYNERGELVSGS